MREPSAYFCSDVDGILQDMTDGLTIYSFPLGAGSCMGYEVTEAAAHKAAREHRASVLADPANVLPTRTPINRVVLRPVSVDVVAAILNGREIASLDLIESTELIGYVGYASIACAISDQPKGSLIDR